MKIESGIAVLELKIQGFGLNPTLLWDEKEAILVDTGMPGQLEQIHDAMNDVGVSFEQLKAIILTHQDIDHIGSLPEIQQKADQSIEVYAHELDRPYIEGQYPLLKGDPNKMSEEKWAALPDAIQALYKNPPTAKVNQTLEDGQRLPFFGGVQVIHTPGHTPGHISLYSEKYKTLIAGDAMVCTNGNLKGPVSQTTPDMETATESLRRFLEFDIDRVICYHGGACDLNVVGQIKKLVGIDD
ncbi:MBL fold metallo-hydrolase [Bacillus gaemokensis]|uniref:Hydrolase n=1 Tax=Bacillus gaemokensis TaxID=574375 RepID=A0A073KKC7_9BACI|nr:MBL fold metallo-hydrolase [Bacillus gaemokensis]KEK22798.1 hydrolase [Bacillus gaemokensis]KYG36788.1 hydrolase [Bacillus gaemokensis]